MVPPFSLVLDTPEGIMVAAEFQGVSSDPPACASAASAWGSQKVISIALCIRHAILTSLG
jgi:hypothetical protein